MYFPLRSRVRRGAASRGLIAGSVAARRAAAVSAPASDALEPRVMLDGNVRVILSGDTLTIRGDDAANSLDVVVDEVNGTVEFDGFDGTTVELIANGVSTGPQDDVEVDLGDLDRPIRNLNVNLLRGNDTIFFDGGGLLIATNDVNVNGREGSDTIEMVDFEVGDDLKVIGHGGNDQIFLADVAVGDDLRVYGNNNDDLIEIDRALVGDDMSLVGGRGDDGVLVNATVVGDDMRVWLGSGENVAIVTQTVVDDDVLLKGGDEQDLIAAIELRSDDDVEIDLEGGDDIAILSGLIVDDNTKVEGDGGDDFVIIASPAGDGFEELALGLLDDPTTPDDDEFAQAVTDALVAGSAVNRFEDLKVDLNRGDDAVVILGANSYDNVDLDGDSGFDLLAIAPGQRADDFDIEQFDLRAFDTDDVLGAIADEQAELLGEVLFGLAALLDENAGGDGGFGEDDDDGENGAA